MTRKHLLAGLASLAVMAFAGSAQAAEVDVSACFFASVDTVWSQDPAPAEAPVVGEDDLAGLSGQGDGAAVALTEQALTALNTGNTVIGGTVGSGAISIDQNAFTGFDGIGNFVINSGHNNNLQSSLSVSIVITP